MLCARLLGRSRRPTIQISRSLRFFKSKEDPPKLENIATPVTEAVPPKTDDRTSESSFPSIQKRNLQRLSPYIPPRQAWVENLNTLEPDLLGLIDLHPDIFAARPRLDLIYRNFDWQRKYHYVDWTCLPAKHEIRRSTRKPWPQKGTGRARHGTRRSPLFMGGVKIHGPRGPKSYFFWLDKPTRVQGLCSCISVKFAQDDLHIVNNLDIPTDDPQYLLNLIEARKWGPSVLLVDVDDFIPKNLAVATNEIKHVNVMPVYGLNVHSMLKHDTLVLTLDAVDRIEERLLRHLHGSDCYPKKFSFSDD